MRLHRSLLLRLNPCAKQSSSCAYHTMGRTHWCDNSGSSLTRGALVQIPGVPVMYLQAHRYTIERLPEATLGGAPRT